MRQNLMLHIHDFHARFGLAYYGPSRKLDGDMLQLRNKRLHEEAVELEDATTLEDLCDAMIDLTYIALGSLYLVGQAQPVFFLHKFESDLQPPDSRWIKELPSIERLAQMGKETASIGCDPGALTALVWYINRIAHHTELPFEELFLDVHAANMRKERGTAHTSKYGNSYDIVKPAGWVGPNGAAILTAHGFTPELKLNRFTLEA